MRTNWNPPNWKPPRVVQCRLVRETSKAICVEAEEAQDGTLMQFWIPRSIVVREKEPRIARPLFASSAYESLVIPAWLLEQKDVTGVKSTEATGDARSMAIYREADLRAAARARRNAEWDAVGAWDNDDYEDWGMPGNPADYGDH